MFTFKPYLVFRLKQRGGSAGGTFFSREPEKGTIRTLPFMVRIAGAGQVVLTGDFTGWSLSKILLAPGPDAEWHTTLELAPGEYQYRLLVDGEWRDHPEASKRVPNAFGGTNCMLFVS